MKSQNRANETRIFIAGATGVMGRRVVPTLVKMGYRISAVGRSPQSRNRLERLGVTPVALDLLDAAAVRRAVAGHEVIINLATSIPPTWRMFLPGAWRMNDRIRRQASANLAAAAIAGGTRRYIQESFAIYPDCGERWIDEQVTVQPAKYSRSVLDAEAAVARFTRQGGVGVTLRFAFFYGPDSPALHDMVRFVRCGWSPVFGAPGAYFPSLSHDDAAAAVVAALDLPAGVFNVADDEPLPRREFLASLAGALGVRPPGLPPRWVEKPLGSLADTLARSLRISNYKLKSESDWKPKYPSVRQGWGSALAGLLGIEKPSVIESTP